MKAILTKILSLTLIVQMSTGSWPAQAAESKSASVASPAAFLQAVKEESESIFGKEGCARVDAKGNISYVSRTTSDGVQNESGAYVADCKARVTAHVPRAQKALKLIEEHQEKSGTAVNTANCADCAARAQAISDDAIPPGGMCSKNDKLRLQKLRASSPQCSMGCELKGSLKKSVGSLGGLVSSNSSCNVDQAGTSAFGCLKDFVVSLFTSLGSMCKAVWDGIKSAGSWIGGKISGLFNRHKKVEQDATMSAGVFANMSDADIKLAQKNPAQANQSLLAKIANGLNWIMENIVGLDTPTYSEMWGCAKCGERIAVICKLSGVLGKDIIKNAILIWIGGKAIGGLAKLGQSALGVLKSAGTSVAARAAKTSVGRVTVAWGAKASASLSTKSTVAFQSFMKTGAGKASAYVAKLGVNGTTNALKVAASGFEKLDNAMLFFPRLFIRGGKTVANEISAIGSRAGIFKTTPRLTADEAAETGLKSIKDIPSDRPLEVEVPNPLTPEMAKAKKSIDQKWVNQKVKGATEDIQNAVEQSFENAGSQSVKVGSGPGETYLKIENPEKVNRIFTYNEGRNALVQMQDGTTLIMAEGKIVGKVPAKEAKIVETLVGAEQRKADDLALQNMKKNAEENGLKVNEANSTPKDPQNEFKVNSGPECGNQDIVFSSGRAL
jgi:hypothetical protein